MHTDLREPHLDIAKFLRRTLLANREYHEAKKPPPGEGGGVAGGLGDGEDASQSYKRRNITH